MDLFFLLYITSLEYNIETNAHAELVTFCFVSFSIINFKDKISITKNVIAYVLS